MIVTTDAIVLRGRKQGDTSKLATLYTRDFGKLDVIAKGAREQKSKFGGALEMFAYSRVVIYKNNKPDTLSLLSNAETIEPNHGILRSLERIETATKIIELILRAMHDEEAHDEIFELLTSTLQAIAQWEDQAARAVQFRFYLQFATLMGFEVDLGPSQKLSSRSLGLLRSIEHSTAEASGISEADYKQLTYFFQTYFADHLPGVSSRSMKSARVFDQL
jgi:DNA repair protein RecO (recombination protein O)